MKKGLSLIVLLLVAAPLAAQNTDLEALAGLTFNFRNPGARSLAMGGAFLGLADDATAAEANPAGLTILGTREISLELRNYRIDTEITSSGQFPEFTSEEFIAHSDAAEVSFASIVLPADKFAFAIYYHQPLRIESEINMAWAFNDLKLPYRRDLPIYYIARGTPAGSGGPVTRQQCIDLQNEELGACTGYEMSPFLSSVAVAQETWGAAAAVELGPLSLGAGVRYQLFSQAALTLRYSGFTLDQLVPVEALIQATELDEAFEPTEEDDLTFTAGFKWTASDRLSFGGVWKQGAEYPTSVFQRFVSDGEVFDEAFDTTFHVPDTIGVGFAFRPLPTLVISADAVQVTYSNLTDNFFSAYPEIQLIRDNTGESPYEIEDSTEYHAGFEYFFASRIPVAIRAGWWREPAHGLKYVGPITCTDEEILEEERVLCSANRYRAQLAFPGGKEEDHYTVGIGLAWPSFQIDAAYDTADSFKIGSISAVFRF